MLRLGEGEPLVLLHGIMCSAGVWREVLPHLAEHHDAIALTALGHRGGRPLERRPARVRHLVDDVERSLDELGLDRVHLAGNSMGGWVALELARRGRARTVCALSPGGMFRRGEGSGRTVQSTVRALERMAADARRARRLLPLAMRSPRVRRYALQLNARRGERVDPRHLLDSVDDVLGCAARVELLTTDESLAPLDPLPCPVTIVWAEDDRVLPRRAYEPVARELVPSARFEVLPDVGHVPMFDDPELVARTILRTTAGAASAQARVEVGGQAVAGEGPPAQRPADRVHD